MNNNQFNLTEREKIILAFLTKGMSYKLIADNCFISINTVRGHIRSIYEKLNVHSKSEAIVKAMEANKDAGRATGSKINILLAGI